MRSAPKWIQIGIATAVLGGLSLNLHSQSSNAAANKFTVVNAPGGGQYIYGPFTGKGSMSEAVLYMLRNIHQYFGNRPDLGNFVQSRDGSQTAAFFTVNAKAAGEAPMTGLFIVARSPDGSASGAVVFDDSHRFPSTEPGMLQSLNSVWHPTGVNAAQGAAAPLKQTTIGDSSASIGLPEGWTITALNGGALTAEGPNHEMVYLGGVIQGYAIGPDMFQSYVEIMNQTRHRNGKPTATFTVIERTNLPGNAIQVIFKLDLNDGVGTRRGSVRLGRWGAQAMSVDGSNLPERLWAQENATLLAVIHSYQPNARVMGQLQQGAMNRVQADAARANAQSAALNARREANTAAFDQHMDNLDRSSKITQDYILDRSVVRDTDTGDRATLNNGYADSLVRANPNRYQVVPSQDLIAGKDY